MMNVPDKLRLLIVESDIAQRDIFRTCCHQLTDIAVESIVPTGHIALDKIARQAVDVILLDYAITDFSLSDFTKKLIGLNPDIGIILTVPENDQQAAVKAVEALAAGAFDFVLKPSEHDQDACAVLQRRVLPKIRSFSIRRYSRRAQRTSPAVPQHASIDTAQNALLHLQKNIDRIEAASGNSVAPELVLIGVSTGGPEALLKVIPQIPSNFPLPVIIVLHMPKLFTGPMAQTLSCASRIPVTEVADNNTELKPGNAYLAPGGIHLEIHRETRNRLVTRFSDAPPENGCRPAVDVLFRSAASVVKGQAIAVVLTGMGSDGAKGVALLKAQGAYIIAQDETTSVVWGMPGCITRDGTADTVLPLTEIVPHIVKRVTPL
jgi:two-component system, chemotaxis family, protein-glutamate methylesterase/glutaminase